MKPPTVASLKKVTPENLARLGADRLAEIVAEAADTRPDLKRRLRMELAAAQGAEHLALDVCAAIVEASPDACLDQFAVGLRERLERPHSGPSGIHEVARDPERSPLRVVAEEHP